MPSTSRAALALALCLPLLHACGGSADEGQVRLVNASSDWHFVDLQQLKPGVTLAQVRDVVMHNGDPSTVLMNGEPILLFQLIVKEPCYNAT